MHTCNPEVLGVEAGRPQVQGHPWLQKLKASLGYLKDPVSNFQYRKGNQKCQRAFALQRQSKTEQENHRNIPFAETVEDRRVTGQRITQIFTNSPCGPGCR